MDDAEEAADHSTIIYAWQTVADLIDTEKKFKGDIADIQKKLKMF